MPSLKRLLKRREFQFRRNGCGSERWGNAGGKFVYPDIYVAMRVCQRLLAEGKTTNPVMFYYCDHCDGIHVGHLGKDESLLMYEGGSIDIRKLQGLS